MLVHAGWHSKQLRAHGLNLAYPSPPKKTGPFTLICYVSYPRRPWDPKVFCDVAGHECVICQLFLGSRAIAGWLAGRPKRICLCCRQSDTSRSILGDGVGARSSVRWVTAECNKALWLKTSSVLPPLPQRTTRNYEHHNACNATSASRHNNKLAVVATKITLDER